MYDMQITRTAATSRRRLQAPPNATELAAAQSTSATTAASPYESKGDGYCSDSNGNTAFARREVNAGMDGKDEAAVEALCTADPKCVALAYLSPGKYVLYTDNAAGRSACTSDCAKNDWQSDRALVTSARCQGDPAPGADAGASAATVSGTSRGRVLATAVTVSPPHAHAPADAHRRTLISMPTPLCDATTKPKCRAKPDNVFPSPSSNGGGAASTPTAGLEANPDPARASTDFQNGVTKLESSAQFKETTMRPLAVMETEAGSVKWLGVFSAIWFAVIFAGVVALWCFPSGELIMPANAQKIAIGTGVGGIVLGFALMVMASHDMNIGGITDDFIGRTALSLLVVSHSHNFQTDFISNLHRDSLKNCDSTPRSRSRCCSSRTAPARSTSSSTSTRTSSP
jgi:hypothetical protein